MLETPIVVAQGLSQPEGMALGPKGDLYVAETGKGQITKLERNGDSFTQEQIKFMNVSIGIPAAPNAAPTWIFSDIAISPDGTLYASDDVESKIWMKKL
jgi:sugar lactone lactonase YvrE